MLDYTLSYVIAEDNFPSHYLYPFPFFQLNTFQKIKKDFILTLGRDHDAKIEKMKIVTAQFKECLQAVEEKSTNSQNETFAEILKCQQKYDGR